MSSLKGRVARVSPPMTEEQKKLVVDLYLAGHTAEAAGEQVGYRKQTVLNHLHACGICRSQSDAIRKYILDQSAFTRRSPEMAYWLGFIVTDGCIYYPQTAKPVSPRLTVGLAERDRGHLLKLNGFLRSDTPVRIKKGSASRTTLAAGGRFIAGGPAAVVVYCSRELVSSLESHGVTPRKSMYESVPPGFEKDVDFWRGVIDGDGWLTHRRQGETSWHVTVGLVGSKELCEGFRVFAAERLGVSVPAVKPQRNIYTARVHGRAAVRLIGTLYADACCSLERKATRAAEIIALDWPERTPSRCAVPGCGRDASAKGLCKMHRRREARNGSPLVTRYRATKPTAQAPCSTHGCIRDATAGGLCRLHYRRTRPAGRRG